MFTVPLNLSETVEPNRRLSTSNQGLSAAQRRQGSVICLITVQGFVSDHEHGRVKTRNFLKEQCAAPNFSTLNCKDVSLKNVFFSSRKQIFAKLFL